MGHYGLDLGAFKESEEKNIFLSNPYDSRDISKTNVNVLIKASPTGENLSFHLSEKIYSLWLRFGACATYGFCFMREKEEDSEQIQ